MSTSPATLEIAGEPPILLEKADDGAILVAGTGIRYYIFLGFYQRGDSPEELAGALPALSLPTIHRLIAYYLEHRKAIDAWLEQIDGEAENSYQEYEARWPTAEFRARMKARTAEMRASPTD